MLKKNVGTIDRIIRVLVGVVLIALTLTHQIGLWGWIGVIPLVTGLMGNCLLYNLLGINTNKVE